MKSLPWLGKTCLLLAFICVLSNAYADEDALQDPDVQKTLQAMHNASTWYHPDLYGMTQGMQAFAHHQYAQALKEFKFGALYADKLSQLCLGLMYLNGAGTAKDPATALAWLNLAAERGYPQFVTTRNEVAKTLNILQLERAKKVWANLATRYADRVAKPRMAVQLRLGMMNITGSHTGFDAGVVQISKVRCGPALVMGGRVIPQMGCGAMNPFLDKENWKPELYFKARDREWMPLVKVGPLTEVGAAKPAQRDLKGSSTPPGPAEKTDSAEPLKH